MKKEIQDEYLAYMGLDIGGTLTKMCLATKINLEI
jgi:hypothetical protein